jgi:hypothetical protein
VTKTAEPDESDRASDRANNEMNVDEVDGDYESQSQGRAADAQTRSQVQACLHISSVRLLCAHVVVSCRTSDAQAA